MRLFLVLVFLTALLFSRHAEAQTIITRYGHINATGACQAALPGSDTELRKNPVYVRNEGDSSVFVSCSAQNHAEQGSYLINISLRNLSAVTAQVQCTLTEGSHIMSLSDAVYFPKTVEVKLSDVGEINWDANADNEGRTFHWVNFSCILPPGVEIGEISNVWDEYLGS